MARLFTTVLFSLMFSFSLYSQNITVIGKVIAGDNKEPLSGAAVRIVNSTRGTYADSRGIFRINARISDKIEITSIGYKSKTILPQSDSVIVSLSPSPVEISGATAVGELSAENAIKRAISKKNENSKKIKTLKGKIYTKMLLEIGGSAFGTMSTSGNSVSITASTRGGDEGENVEKYRLWMTETFSDLFIDNDKNINRRIITERRQTANMEPDQNIVSLGNFLNFYDNTIKMINTNFTTPLADGGLAFYDYKMEGKSMIDDKYVYNISFAPKSSIFPGFKGSMKLLEGDYNVIEFKMEPSPSNSVDFIKNISAVQKFKEVSPGIWYPDYLEMTGKAAIDALRGVFELGADINVTAIINDISANVPLPDSIYTSNTAISVSPLADSAKSNFWASNAPIDLSEKELAIYQLVDSLVALDTLTYEPKKFSWSILPAVDYNRVSSFEGGGIISVSFKDFVTLSGKGVYNFGQKKAFGRAGISFNPWQDLKLSFTAFSEVKNMSPLIEDWPRLLNAAWFIISKSDHFDYYRGDGWKADVAYTLYSVKLMGAVLNERSFALKTKEDFSFFDWEDLRENPAADMDNYLTFIGNAGSSIKIPGGIVFDWNINGFYGSSQSDDGIYSGSTQEAQILTPLFDTGFEPATLKLKAGRGQTRGDIPAQYLYRMKKSLGVVTRFGNFLTAPTAWYGGDYNEVHAEIDINDLWWRFLHLPRISEGRGIGLAISGSWGSFSGKGFYHSTENQPGDIWGLKNGYIEAGFGLNRIPTFVSNLIFLGFDARWRITNQPVDKFGWALSVNFPF